MDQMGEVDYAPGEPKTSFRSLWVLEVAVSPVRNVLETGDGDTGG
jgi:hypothetical protein